MVTVREIAEKAGVSIGTVSRVLNNKPGVSDDKRALVLSIIRETGYAPQKRIQPHNSKVTHVGVLIRPTGQTIASDVFYGDVFRGAEHTFSELQINLSFSTLDIANGRLRTLPPLAGDERIQGVVLIGALPREIVDALVQAIPAPFVLVDNFFDDCVWDAVMTDNLRGATLATRHLIERGHRQIAFLGGPEHPSIIERRVGYENTVRKHGLPATVFSTPDLTTGDGQSALLEMLQKAPQCTAIMCANDNLAIGALRQLQSLEYKAPEELSIVGFDDIHTTGFTSPPITTIHIDRVALGQLAAQLLIGRINNPERAIIESIVGVTLIERASVSAPRTYPLSCPDYASVQEGEYTPSR
jgi:DNA-binding LacI/PurR family transcriptional regulator